MGRKYHIYSPSVRTGLAYDALIEPPLRGVDIMADGTLFFLDDNGVQDSRTFVGITVPYRFVMQISKIVGNGSGSVGDGTTGTDLALTDIKGLD